MVFSRACVYICDGNRGHPIIIQWRWIGTEAPCCFSRTKQMINFQTTPNSPMQLPETQFTFNTKKVY